MITYSYNGCVEAEMPAKGLFEWKAEFLRVMRMSVKNFCYSSDEEYAAFVCTDIVEKVGPLYGVEGNACFVMRTLRPKVEWKIKINFENLETIIEANDVDK